jgi:hypothetical protein
LKSIKEERDRVSESLAEVKEQLRGLSTQYEIGVHDKALLTTQCEEKISKIEKLKATKKVTRLK